MKNYNEDVFQFSDENDDKMEQAGNFNYDSISGLGESNYENEDLFKTEESHDDLNRGDHQLNNIDSNENLQYNNTYIDSAEQNNSFYQNGESDINNIFSSEVEPSQPQFASENNSLYENNINNFNTNGDMIDTYLNNNYENYTSNSISAPLETQPQANSFEETKNLDNSDLNSDNSVIENDNNQVVSEDNKVSMPSNIDMSDTSIEELNKLTEYKKEEIESTNINELFDRVSVNVKDASDIFRKNTEMKQKIDSRFNELKKLQSEVENAKKNQMDEINNYKEDVLNKLTEKKEEIEKRLNTLKELQSSLEKEKKEFEEYKKKEQENIDKVQREVQSAYDDRREELNHIEDVLRKQKDALDEERNQLSLDRIQYESDKNELANNLLKFNEIVNSFTNGVEGIEQ